MNMKKTIWAAALAAAFTLAVLFASCDDSDGGIDGGAIVPRGVHIAGNNYSYNNAEEDDLLMSACYWTGDSRIDLDMDYVDSIMASGGAVLINGAKRNRFYWFNGKRYEKNEASDLVTIKNGEIFIVKKSDYSETGFTPDAVTVSGGKVYVAGTYRSEGSYYVSYYVDGVMYDTPFLLDNSEHHREFWIDAIAVSEESSVYVAGGSSIGMPPNDFAWYYADGKFVKYQTDQPFFFCGITLYKGKVYIFASSYREPDENNLYWKDDKDFYWVDGKKVTVGLPKGSYVYDYAMAGGKMYMAGYYQIGDRYQACYWVDGKRYNLSGAFASSIFVEK